LLEGKDPRPIFFSGEGEEERKKSTTPYRGSNIHPRGGERGKKGIMYQVLSFLREGEKGKRGERDHLPSVRKVL